MIFLKNLITFFFTLPKTCAASNLIKGISDKNENVADLIFINVKNTGNIGHTTENIEEKRKF